MSSVRIAVPLQLDPRVFAGLDRTASVTGLTGLTMGTRWSVRLVVPRGVEAGEVSQAVEARLAGLVAELSHWEPDSLLSGFNRGAAGSWTALPPDFATVMAAALDIAERSGGAFDPTIGRLVNLWGFGPEPVTGAPDDERIEAARRASGWRRLAYDAGRLRQPGGLALDLSGIAKGYAVDAVSGLLGEMGVRHCLVEIGGECVGKGVRPDFEPWWVDLETPPGMALPPLRVALHELAVATSGDYVRGGHTIDPRTGRPAVGVVAVSVLHSSAMTADAWASAMVVLGAEEAARLARREALAARCIFHNPGGVGEWISPALQALM